MSRQPPEISIVIPCYNEEGNLRALANAITSAMDPLHISYEVVITDDGSADNSWTLLKEIAVSNPRFRVQRFNSNCGESAASWAGMMAARGRYIITLDADLQNDPRDVPKFFEALRRHDCVCGTRVETRGKGDNFIRIISSRIAHCVRNKLSDENPCYQQSTICGSESLWGVESAIQVLRRPACREMDEKTDDKVRNR